jgi:[ribosomal protein S18]-alanine N-acetyltransferase
MRLRSYRDSDLDTLYRIDQACFPPGVSYSRQELEDFVHHRRSATWVAESQAELVGFLVANRELPHAGHIITIDVVEAWRRRGVGRALMDVAEAWAEQQNLLVIFLETAVDNTAAQRFYESRGYERFRRIEQYYGNGAAAWLMVKRLKKSSTSTPEA